MIFMAFGRLGGHPSERSEATNARVVAKMKMRKSSRFAQKTIDDPNSDNSICHSWKEVIELMAKKAKKAKKTTKKTSKKK